jgi:glutathione S-transferase
VPDLEKDHADMIPVWRERGAAGLALLDDYLQQREFITDYGYSVADIAVFGYTHLANEGGFNLGDYPAISAWISRVEAQPGYRPINELLDGNDTQLSRAA